jgi:signal transduction histidine kinase
MRTEEVGKGTGQGLAIARSVIAKGTTFFIRLPIDVPSGAAPLQQEAA